MTWGKVAAVFFALAVAAAAGAGLIVYVKKQARAEAMAEMRQASNLAPQPAKPPPRALPDFAFVNQDGEPVSKDSLRGKVWLANFIFTTCPGQCIVLANEFKAFQEKIKGMPNVELVSFSVDPEYDTPEVLKQFAEQYEAGSQWTMVTGDKEAIYRLLHRGFLLDAAPNPDAELAGKGEKIVHTRKVVLVGPQGRVRHYYLGLNEDNAPEVLRDIEQLLPAKDAQP